MKSSKPAGPSKVFLFSAANGITAFSSEPDARRALGEGDVLFASPDELRQITADWPGARLVHLWNSIPGVVRIKKFTDRPTALTRLWAAVQAIEPIRPPQVDMPSPKHSAGEARHGTKKAMLLSLLKRPQGASVPEIMAALGWQSHSVRGCLSTLSRKGVSIHSFRRPDGDRAYSIEGATEPNPEGVQ